MKYSEPVSLALVLFFFKVKSLSSLNLANLIKLKVPTGTQVQWSKHSKVLAQTRHQDGDQKPTEGLVESITQDQKWEYFSFSTSVFQATVVNFSSCLGPNLAHLSCSWCLWLSAHSFGEGGTHTSLLRLQQQQNCFLQTTLTLRG